MKFTEELKQKYADIILLRSALVEPTLLADQMARINTFVTEYCEHATQFKIAINLERITLDPLQPVTSEQLQNVFTVFDYVCYLDIYLSEDNPDQAFFLHPINPEFRRNPIIRRDLVLKIQSYLNKVLDRLATQDRALQANLNLFDEALSISRTLTFDPISIDDLITNALIRLMLVSFTINLVDLNISDLAGIFAMLEHDRAGLLKLLTQISTPLSLSVLTSSIFNTCFNNHYYGLDITEYEQLRAKALEVVSDLDSLILDYSPSTKPEESAPSAESDNSGTHDLPAVAPMLAPEEVTIPRPATPVGKIITAPNPILEHSPIPFQSPGLSDASDVPTPLYCVGEEAGVQWTPPRRGIDTSYLNTSTPDTGCSRHHLLYTPAGRTDLSASAPGTGDRRMTSSTASPADTLREVRKGFLPHSRRLRDQGSAVSCLDLDASVEEANQADLSGVVNPAYDPPITIPGRTADAAESSRTNGRK